MRGTSTEREREMEAAEALAGLARSVPGRKRRSGNGKRRMKVVKEEVDEEKEEEELPIVDLAPICPDLVRVINSGDTDKLKMEVDDPAFPHQECATELRNVDVVQMTTEQDSVFPDGQNQMCVMSYLSSGGDRSRHNAEKEAKRIRRVLANRESARRTIRRRQALCEDLTSKAAELMEENQRLKKTKQIALQEIESLETTNKNLKAQIASSERKTALGNTCKVNSSSNGNYHEGTSNAPQLPSPSLCRRDLLHKQEKLLNMAGPGPPVYMIPCPWFVTPCSKIGNVDKSSAENNHPPPVTVKTEPPYFIVGDLNEVPLQSPPLGQFDMVPKFAKVLKPGSEEANHGNGFGLDRKYGSFDSDPVRSSNQENIQQTVSCGKKLGDAAAATEARRRRREITRMKSVNGRRC